MMNFCPKCGTEKGPFIKGFCTKCFLEDNKLINIDKRFSIAKCKRCGKILVSGRWVKDNADNLTRFVLSKIKWYSMAKKSLDLEIVREAKGAKLYLNVSGEIEGKPINATYESFIEYRFQYCDACLKISSSYHEAVIQIRFQDKSREKEVLFLVKEILASKLKEDTLAQIVKTIRRKNGYDLLIGSKKAAKLAVAELKKKYKAKIKVSPSLIGITKDGRNKIRYTYSVRIS